MFGYKLLLAEKDARIADLKQQISRLEGLVPALQRVSSVYHIPVMSVESDAILSGRDEPIELTAEQETELSQIERDRSEESRILSGTYDA